MHTLEHSLIMLLLLSARPWFSLAAQAVIVGGALLFGMLVASMAWRALEVEVAQASYRGQLGVLPLAGLLTEIDLLIAARDVYALMLLNKAVTVTPDTPRLELARLRGERQSGCLPVVEADGRLIGRVTESAHALRPETLACAG